MGRKSTLNTKGFDPKTGQWNDSQTGDFLWSNTNIGEAIPNAMTPFTWSVFSSAYSALNVLPGYHSAGNICGRAYQNGTVLYTAFKAIGKDPIELMNEMGGGMDSLEGLTLPTIDLPRWAALNILSNGLRIQFKERAARRGLRKFIADTPLWCQHMRQRIKAASNGEPLQDIWSEMESYSFGAFWRTVSTNWNYTARMAKLRGELSQLLGDADTNTLLTDASQQSGQLASLGPLIGISKVVHGEMDRGTYLEEFGHRGPYETELSIPRPAEDPTWLDQQIAALEESSVNVETLLDTHQAEFGDAWSRLCRRFPQKREEIQHGLDKATENLHLREAVRSESIRVLWVTRIWALKAGELTGLGKNIFYLTTEEVHELLSNGNQPWIKYIAARKETHTRYQKLPPYPTLISGQFDPFTWAADPKRRHDVYDSHIKNPRPAQTNGQPSTIKGIGGSSGCIEGVVRVLARPEQGNQLQPGEILVTNQTNIGWTLIFPRSAGVITDVGALLSHAAIVARELGIPAVVGCGDATARLKTGDRVLLDGNQGIVKIL